jgi:hypothetical protein
MRLVPSLAALALLPLLSTSAIACSGAELATSGACAPFLPIALVEPSGGFAPGCPGAYPIVGDAGALLLECPPACPTDACRPGDLSCTLVGGCSCVADSGALLRVLRGSHAGAVTAGLGERFARDTDQREGTCYADYHGNGMRLVALPVVDAAGPGRDSARLRYYALFFLGERPGKGRDRAANVEFLGRADATR